MPTPKNRPVQSNFSVPGVREVTPRAMSVLFGASEYARSFHVINGMMVSIRGSTDAAANCTCPP
jgi:hypothetical protein